MRPTLSHLGPDDWQCWRDMRLAALADSPHAFASSLAKERGYAEADWRDWLGAAGGLKVVAEGGAGLVGGWEPDDQHGAVELYSMWVAPEWRGRGLGDRLVDEVLTWSAGRGQTRVDLWVAEGNPAAERLYQRHGFRLTDRRQPHPGRAGVLERAMTCQVAPRVAPR
ncbi:GNAT family N-acetyltransferase [Actinoplanes sp. CA-054009]